MTISRGFFPLLVRGVCCAALAAAVSGCVLSNRINKAISAFHKAGEQASSMRQDFERTVHDSARREAAQDVARPWIAGRPQPLARDIVLPPALRADVNTALLFSDGPLDLTEIARRITVATGIAANVQAEALLPPQAFMPRLAEAGSGGSATTVPAAMHAKLDGAPEPLAHVLDRLAARLNVRWRYRNARIEFYRTETRTYIVRALALNASVEASMGVAGNGTPGGFVGASRTRLESGAHDALATVRARIEPFLTRSGVLVAEPGAAGAIVVTDTPDVLDRIAAFIDQENRGLTRRVRLVFEELAVQAHDNAEAGLDWSVVFSSAQAALSAATPGVGAGRAGAAGLVAHAAQGAYGGSEAIVRAVSEVGHVVRRSRFPVLTLNRRPVTHAVRTTFSYIDKVETLSVGAIHGNAVPKVSVSQSEQTVGSLLTIVPDAQEDGQILLSIAYDSTVAQPLRSVALGDKDHPLQLQQITIDGNGIVQQLAVRPGQPALIAGFDQVRHETSGRRLNPGLPMALGGENKVADRHVTTIVIVTAQLEEG
ncbi:hypothetical protein GSY71_01940 [Pusillimonas sp. TS35]|uniref:hypothetical protein n=1 Tax=Paracandidimonas lactea TaxID=2895524 RepID=UPI00137068AF|nr:hypothetical protein [Paracandidimonas lactea]MYN11915.1 hypothetical protein [Pusillimonas sp. TS35]